MNIDMYLDDENVASAPEAGSTQEASDQQRRIRGTVFRKYLGRYDVRLDEIGYKHSNLNGSLLPCKISTKLRKQFDYPTADPGSLVQRVREVKERKHVDPLAVGDHVRVMLAGDGTGVIVERLERRTKLTRRTAAPMPGAHTFEQVIAANIDQVVAVFAAAQPKPKWNMLDRYLVAAESLDLKALVCITKLDLVDNGKGRPDRRLMATVEEYRRIGYPVVLTSIVTGAGLIEMQHALTERTSVVVGKSGVGKTSLLNALQPELGLRIAKVNRKTGKGVHTTTHLEMYALDFGGALVDTPGVREFGLWDPDLDDLAWLFPEMRPHLGGCRFGMSCRHDEEPDCAVKNAVLSGSISPRRYKSYLRLQVDA